MEKKYKLLKDTPKCLAGDIFVSDGDDYYRNERNGQVYESWVVESKPEWFSEILPEPVWPKGIVEFKGDQLYQKNALMLMYGYNDWVDFNMNHKRAITSVENSSGEKFSVGDKNVRSSYIMLNGISAFKIEGDTLCAVTSSGGVYPIDALSKLTPKVFTQAEIEAAIEESILWVYDENQLSLPALSQRIFRKALGI
jgi:hypothetical protein